MKKIILILILTLFLIPCYASNDFLAERTERLYNEDSGLVNAKANDIVQTNDGYIYIAQYAGLTRYDGKSFTTISEYNDISLESIEHLYVSSDGTLWIGTDNGLISYKNNIFEIISEKGNAIYDITEDADNNVIFSSKNGIYKIENGKSSKMEKIVDTPQTIAVAKNGLYVADTSSKMVFHEDGQLVMGLSGVICVYSKDATSNTIYAGSSDGYVHIYNIDNNTIKDLKVSERQINSFYAYLDDIYVATDDGVFVIDSKTQTSQKIEGLSITSSVERIIFDYEGTMWVASSSQGVLKLIKSDFIDYFFKANLDDELVNAITKYNGATYIGTDKKLVINKEDGKELTTYEISLMNKLNNCRIRDLEVFNGYLFIATYTENIGLIVFDGTSIFEYNSFNYIRCIKSNDNYIVFGLDDQIVYFTKDKVKSKDFSVVNNYIQTNSLVLSLNVLDDKFYACVKSFGLAEISFDNIKNNINDCKCVKGSESKTPLKSILIDDTIIFSENSSLFYSKNDETKQVNLKFNGSVVGLFKIESDLWVLTDLGIYVIDLNEIKKEDIAYKYYNKNNGLTSSIIANSSCYYDGTYLYLATSTGVFLADPKDIGNNVAKQKIMVNSVNVDGTKYSDNSLVNINKNAKRIDIDFAVLSYINDDIKIKYWLEGYDQEPIIEDYSNVDKISYTNLRGGNYTFHLEAFNSNGESSVNIINLKLQKDYKVYERAWFIILMILLSFAVLGFVSMLITKLRTKQLTKRNDELRAITKESIEAIAQAVDKKDHYTNGHSVRVGEYTRIIAAKMGVTGQELENMFYIGLLHDIGKIGIIDSVLNKPASLNDEELKIMRAHTIYGGEIIESITTIPNIVEGVKYHHEKYDGTGYPEGKKLSDLPLVVSIIGCADAYDAMSSDRVYRKALSKEVILNEFMKKNGTQFNPEVQAVVIELIKNDELVYNKK